MTPFLTELERRGFVHDATPELAARLRQGPVTAYVGFDPTADSLHVGNLVPIMGLAWLQRFGGRPLALVGGGTGLVGDPSGKRAERPMLDAATVAANAAALRAQLRRFLAFDASDLEADARNGGPPRQAPAAFATLVNNADWLAPLPLLEFLRDTGKHFTVNYMLQKDSVRSRMDAGISFTEFAYMLVQAHDFHHLFVTEGCELQMGGSDQWGNITAGTELISRREGRQAHGLVFPLLTTASGAKFGKSEEGNVWLDPAKTSPYKFHQFWLNTDDRDVERLLRFFTFLDLEEVAAIAAEHAADPGRRLAQRRLADEVTTVVHGATETRRANEAGRAAFGGDGEPDYAVLAATMPTVSLAGADLAAAPALTDLLVRAGLAASKGEARRGIEGRGYSVNGEQVADVNRRVTPADVRQERFILLRKGKKHHAMVVVE